MSQYRWDCSLFSVRRLLKFLSLIALSTAVVFPRNLSAEPFSIILVPDPQYYTEHPSYDLYSAQSRWIRDNWAGLNTKHVIYLGDLTNDNESAQWTTADAAYSILDSANLPYAVIPGNHDYKTNNTDGWVGVYARDLTKYNGIVGPSRFSGKSWYGGNFEGSNANNYTYVSVNGLDFMAVGLEYAPRKEVLTWANSLIGQHPNHRVIIFTHAYTTVNGAYTGGAASKYGMVGSDGADIFEECASRHSNVFMVVCGHVTESKVNTKIGVCGNTIYEMLVDYQGEKVKGTGVNLGNGWLRRLQFDPENNKIHASTITVVPGDSTIFLDGITQLYHSNYASSPTHIDHQFTMDYNMGPPAEPYTYLADSVEFHDMTVNDVAGGDQLDPDIAQAANGDWAAVWEDDEDNNGIYRLFVRGFDWDGNERFADTVVNTSGVNTTNAVNPVMAMAPDGRFVVAWQRSTTSIRMRAYNANGTAVSSGEQTVVSTTTGAVRNPDVAIDDAGNFVVTWADDSDGNGSYQARARGFTFNYTERFAAKTINTQAAGQQQNPVIAMAGNGDYVIAWDDDQNNDGSWDLGARGFFANETQRFGQIVVNSTTAGQQRDPDIAMDDSGRFVVVWEDDYDLNSSYQIKARAFSATGSEILSERTVNLLAGGNQINPAVAMDSFSNWYPVWQDDGVDGGQGYQMMTNEFTIGGTRIFSSDVQANSVKAVEHHAGSPSRNSPAISAHKSGRYIVAWCDDMDGNGSFQILARGVPGTARSLVTKAHNGTVTRSPQDVFYSPNASVSLTATPNTGYSFTGWQGDVPAGSEMANPLAITMDTSKNLVATFGSGDVPAAPSSLTAAASSSSQINLSWTDNSANEANFIIARSTTSGGPYSDIASLGANSTTYSNTGLSANTTYYYVVRATNTSGSSANSNEANALTWPADIIVDNSSSGFTASSNWSTATSAADKYGSDYRYRPTAAVSDPAKWSFTVPQSRNYAIYAWWSAGTNRSSAAPYVLPDSTTVTANQQTNGGKWNVLATKSLTAGTNVVQLSCWASTGFVVIADAIKLTAN